jgi:hypothetical protein
VIQCARPPFKHCRGGAWGGHSLPPMECRLSGLQGALVMLHRLFCMCIINACSSAREFLVCVGGEGRCYDHVDAAPGMHVWWGQVGRLHCTSWYACVVRAWCSHHVAGLGICECAGASR